MYERISVNPEICHGQVCIKGTRIPVHQIIRMLANGDTVEELVEDYPSLEREDIWACLEYAASLTRKKLHLIKIHSLFNTKDTQDTKCRKAFYLLCALGELGVLLSHQFCRRTYALSRRLA